MRVFTILSLALSLVFAAALPALATDEEESLDLGAPAMDLLPALPGKAMPEGSSPEGSSPEAAVPYVVFSGNTGERYYSIGVAQQGFLTRFVSPAAFNMFYYEGYSTCSYKSGVLAFAYEYGGEAWGGSWSWLWGPPTVTSTSPLTIVRKTTDNRLQLTQVFTADKTEIDVTIKMTLKNISGQTLTDVELLRFADIDVPVGSGADDWGGRSSIRAFVFQRQGVALDLLSSAPGPFPYLDPTNQGPTCGGASVVGPLGAGDHKVKARYYFGTMSAGSSKTVKFRYSRL